MAQTEVNRQTETLINDLRKVSVFSDLSQEQLAWFVDKAEEIRLRPGEVFARPGDPAVWLVVMLEGEIRFQLGDDPDAPVFGASAGQITGYLPYSRLTQFHGTGRAVVATRMLRLHRDHFPEMLQRIPAIGQRLVAIMSDRIRETARIETQRDKLAALGKLSAGLAHELNNPAAAALRATANLREALETVRDASIRLARHALSAEQRESIIQLEREATLFVPEVPADPLAQSDREEQIGGWLEKHQVVNAWKIAPVLADMGVEPSKLESLAADVGTIVLSDALVRIASILTITRLISEIENSTRRISDLVHAIKEYSYMDRAAMQEVDLHQGIESTLAILGHRLKGGVKVVREYGQSIPKICAFGGELNQVWTNLLDNAIEAMQGKGEIHVRTAVELDRVVVEVRDNGPGIPPEVQAHIFDPFFTTKGVGEGTGLGLDTVCRIVRNHHGEVRVVSQPGDTRFQVYLPITQPKASSPAEQADAKS
ncbi:MAG TPA: ATP-binding protein [Terriglobia bacterium]|nr:ATP-binding protein [Terriglobia bacterium]